MSIIVHRGDKPVKMTYPQDPDSALVYTLLLRPDEWQPNTIYYANRSVVIPTTFNGHAYAAIAGGTSGTAEPSWPCDDSIVNDDCVQWQKLDYSFYLDDNKNLTLADWIADDSNVLIEDITISENKTEAKISSIPADVAQVTITVHLAFDNGEEDDRSFVIKVKQL